jgi:hypothetical protein
MTRYAYVRGDQVVSVFETDRPASDFPDLALEVVAASVKDNMARDGLGGFKVADPVPNPKEDRRQAYIAQLNTLLALNLQANIKTLIQALRDKEG